MNNNDDNTLLISRAYKKKELMNNNDDNTLLISRVCFDLTSSWYNCNGWLGIKHQVTYLYLLWLDSDGGVHVAVAEVLRGWRRVHKIASPSLLVLPAFLKTLTWARSAMMMAPQMRRRTTARMTSLSDGRFRVNSRAVWSPLEVYIAGAGNGFIGY